MRSFFTVCCLCLALIAMTLQSATAADGQQHTKFNVHKDDQGQAPKQSIFDLTFGSVPKLATERGILIIDAFFDADGDQKHGPDEDTLFNVIQCKINKIDYSVPAFIPGLDYQETYELECHGNRYIPEVNEDLVFIRKRGQVIQIDLPCRLRGEDEQVSQDHTPTRDGKNATATN